jgi:Putative peptidoglycan binding domain
MNQNTDAREQRAAGQSAGPAAPATAAPRPPDRDRPGRRGWVVAGVVVVVAAAGLGAALATGAFRGSGRPASASSGYATGTAMVTRQSLTSQTQENATLGDAGTWSVAVPANSSSSAASSSSSSAAASGTFTWLPQIGQVIRQGQQLYGVSGGPVLLLYGPVPAYRDLSEGMTGADVAELNRDLVKLGYATRAALGPRSGWDYYSAATAYAVDLLQTKLGLTVTGTLPLGQAAFLPGPALVTGLGTSTSLGGPATSGTVVLTATSVTPVVTVELDPSLQSEVKDGDQVSITLPDGSITPGTVTQVGRVATAPSSSSNSGGSASQPGNSSNSSASGSGATITVLVSLAHPKAAGKLNQAPVTVTITTGSVSSALTVPVDALLAQPGGGYAVEVTGPGGHHLVRVTPGMFDDAAGLVQVSGNLTAGQHVVVPGI